MSCSVPESTGPKPVLVQTYQGDSVRFTATFTDAADKPIDVTGWTWLAQLRAADDTLAGAYVVDVTNATDGVLVLTLTEAQTTAMPLGDLLWDVEANDGTDTRTVLNGKLRVREDVSRAS